MDTQLAVLLGLASAAVWGAGDFSGGMGARRASVLTVLVLAETSGLVLLFASGWIAGEPIPSAAVAGWGIAAGLSGTIGLAALYRGLAVGRASIVAPVSAVIGAALPALYSALTNGLPAPLKLLGFALALGAIVLVGQANEGPGEGRALGLASLAGLGFGGFFVLIHQGGSSSTFFPLAVARGVSIPLLLVAALARRVPLLPPRAVAPVIVLSGLLDAGGNILFLLASQRGRLDVATILASLYPASTVILERLVLGERTNRLQQLGVAAALVAIALIAL